MQRGEAETADDEALESGKAAVGRVGRNGEDEKEPCLKVCKGLYELRFLEHLVFDAGFVFADAVDYTATLVVAEEPGFYGVVGKNEVEDDTWETVVSSVMICKSLMTYPKL